MIRVVKAECYIKLMSSTNDNEKWQYHNFDGWPKIKSDNTIMSKEGMTE